MSAVTEVYMFTKLPQLNRTEFALLKILWRAEKSSAREIHQSLPRDFSWAYSTTRTNLERMVKKGFLVKENFHGLYLYLPKVSKVAALAARVKEFAESVLELDPAPVVSLFAANEHLSAEEIEEIEEILSTADPATTKATGEI
jgi:predicted transcriptional regulator